MNRSPLIAIIDANMLTCIGLREIILRMLQGAEVRTFNAMIELIDDTPDAYAHYFVSSHLLMEYTPFFLERRNRTFVITQGEAMGGQLGEFRTLNCCQPEERLIKSLLRLQQHGHHHGMHLPDELQHPTPKEPNGLSTREVEVLQLIVRGFINKEIADRLCISLTTVISHRKNLVEKLNIRSVSGLTIYAVMNGYVEVEEI